MACSKTSVEAALDLRPGDQVFFGGTGLVSRIIAAGTCSWWEFFTLAWIFAGISHVETVFRYRGQLMLCGSTTMESEPCAITGKLIRGVQAHPLVERIRTYGGRVWVCRLNKIQRLSSYECKILNSMVLDKLGTPYDDLGCMVCGTRFVKLFWSFDRAKKFCSELSLWFLTQLHKDVTSPGRSGRISPASLARACVNSELFDDLVIVKSNPTPALLDCEV